MAIAQWKAGERITAGRLNKMLATYSTWTPTWTTTNGLHTPSYGDAVISTEYTLTGNLCVGRMEITFGAATNFGAGAGGSDNWAFSTPVAAAATTLTVGWGEIYDDSAGLGSRMGVRLRLFDTTHFEVEISSGRVDGAAAGATGLIDSISPWTWAVNDHLYATFAYPTAAT